MRRKWLYRILVATAAAFATKWGQDARVLPFGGDSARVAASEEWSEPNAADRTHMPAVSFDSKSFLLPGGRTASRFPIVGAAFDAVLHDPADWASELGRLRHAGFNSVVVRVPWLLHEPTPGRFEWSGRCDVRRLVQLAGAAGLRVVLRIGPCVGGGFALGGLPGWLAGLVAGRVREADPAFLARVTAFWRALAPQFVDLQASRNGSGTQRPLIAVGIEDDWRCLDGEVGHAYFSSLVRFAREVGIDVPLITANNCWFVHEGAIDAWSGAADAAATADELREIHPDAPPLLMHAPSVGGRGSGGDAARDAGQDMLARVVGSIAARADFVCDVAGGAHRVASSVRGCAERAPQPTFALRRALVFASTFGDMLAGMTPEVMQVPAQRPAGKSAVAARALVGTGGERVTISMGRQGVECVADRISVAGARLERCTGSLVALLGDIVVIAGAPRARVQVTVDGSAVSLTVPAEGSAPKVHKVRGLRVAVVPNALADGVGIAGDGIEFVDEAGTRLARIARDGSVEHRKDKVGKSALGKPPARTSSDAPVALTPTVRVIERGLLDGTDARFARTALPCELGAFGLQSMHGFVRARCAAPKRRGSDIWLDGRGIARTNRVAASPRTLVLVGEIRADFRSASGAHTDGRAGMVGPLREVTPLKGVKGAVVDLPRFDATRVGRLAWGYESRAESPHRRTVRWTFAARTSAVIVRMPAWWFDEGHVQLGHALRLNGGLLPTEAWCGRGDLLLDASLLAPMRPKALAKGEKPPKAAAARKGAGLEAVPNELLLDLDPAAAVDARGFKRLLQDVVFLEVRGEIAAEWAFARVSPPASWAAAEPLARSTAAGAKSGAAPTWFRTGFRADAAVPHELSVVHPAGSVATVMVNGECVMVLDGASGTATGTGRKRGLLRHAVLPAALVRAGDNEICVFEPDGVLPGLAVRATARSGATPS